MRIVALDIGGGGIRSAVWDGYRLIEKKETPIDGSRGGKYVTELAVDIIKQYEFFDAIGISTAGQVDTREGSIYHCNGNIPGYTGTPLAALMRQEFHVPVAVENNVNAAALGEMAAGAAKGLKDFICVTYGTGVGGAIIIGGKLYSGSSYSGGSFGGIIVHPEDMVEGEEFSGCYEKYASARALVNSAMKIDAAYDEPEKILADRERPGIKELLDRWIDEITIGLVTLAHVFNPSDIIIEGKVMEHKWLVEEIERRLMRNVGPGYGQIRLHTSGLMNSAGLMGAAYLASMY